eukprot:1583458-Lingulodinium_polyedra.AAC.1
MPTSAGISLKALAANASMMVRINGRAIQDLCAASWASGWVSCNAAWNPNHMDRRRANARPLMSGLGLSNAASKPGPWE